MDAGTAALQEATAISNEWRSHAFRELREFDAPSGAILSSGDVVGAVRSVEISRESEYSIWGPSQLSLLALRGADASGEDPDSPNLADLEGLLDDWLGRVEGETVPSIELPVATRGAARVLASRGFQPISALAVRKLHPEDATAAGRHGVKLRRPEPGDRDALLDLLRELHQADWEAGSAAKHGRLDDHLMVYVDRIVADPGQVWVAHYFGMLTGFAGFAADDTKQYSSYRRERYLQFASVTRRMRGGGIGHALVDALHRDAAAADIEAITVNYAVMNADSAPFWHRRGYRPLTTIWRRLGKH